jgi:hypothetical protein
VPDHTFADLACALNRSPVYLRGLQTRFALPVLEGAAYADSCLAFLRTIVFLRTFGVSEDALLRLWHLETKRLALLHVDSTGSPTWFLKPAVSRQRLHSRCSRCSRTARRPCGRRAKSPDYPSISTPRPTAKYAATC